MPSAGICLRQHTCKKGFDFIFIWKVLCVGYASLSFPVSEWKEVDSSTGGFSRIGSTASFTESTGSARGFRTKIGRMDGGDGYRFKKYLEIIIY